MSRKTRKQKLRQQQRLVASEPKNFSPTYSFSPAQPTAPLEPTSVKIAPSAQSSFSDLRRILILTLIAICAQGVLWYLIEKGTIKLF